MCCGDRLNRQPNSDIQVRFSELAGRAKNYLFIGSEGAAKAAAIAYTLIETAKLSGVDSQAWLTDTAGRILDHKITRLAELMPWRYAQT